jgi:hypothetical protein
MSFYLRCVLTGSILTLSLATFLCCASERMEEYPDLIMHGESYSNACVPENQKVMRDSLFTSGAKDAGQAWQVISAILCSPNDTVNRAYIKRLVQRKVRMSIESTGEKPEIRTVERNDEIVEDIIAAGHAWKANIRIQSGKIFLRYFASEACVEGVTLSFKNGEWSIYEFGVACD